KFGRREGGVKGVPIVVVETNAVIRNLKAADRLAVEINLPTPANHLNRYTPPRVRREGCLFYRLKRVHHGFEERKQRAPCQHCSLAYLVLNVYADRHESPRPITLS